jgi:hypothetical protein
MAVLVAGLPLALSDNPALVGVGIALISLSIVALIALATLFSAIGAYARALIYRYAVGLPTPGIDTRVLAGAFRPKG